MRHMSKKKKEKNSVIGSCKLVCDMSKWSAYTDSCDKILSFQNCMHFIGPYQPCDCFSVEELDIKDRELETIEQMIIETENPDNIAKISREVLLSDEDEPPIEEVPKKKRRRRKKPKPEEEL